MMLNSISSTLSRVICREIQRNSLYAKKVNNFVASCNNLKVYKTNKQEMVLYYVQEECFNVLNKLAGMIIRKWRHSFELAEQVDYEFAISNIPFP